MLQFSNSIEVAVANRSGAMEARDHFKNGASSKSRMSRGNKKKFLGVTIACIVILFYSCASWKSHTNSDNKTNQMIGVWKHVSSQMSGASSMEIIKVITKERFIMAYIVNNEIVASKEGTYTFDGETYTEIVEFATKNQEITIGKKAKVKVRFDNNKIYTSGIFENIPLNEVWERVE